MLSWVGIAGGSGDRKSTRLNSSHLVISYAVFCLKKKELTGLLTRASGDDQGRSPRHALVCCVYVEGGVRTDRALILVEVVPFAVFYFFFNDTATTEIYTLSLHDALPI